MISRSFFAGIIFSAATLASAPVAEAADRALLVGVDSYAVRPLTGAVRDVDLVEKTILEILGFAKRDVLKLTNGAANYDSVMRAMEEWLIAGTGPGDRALFYFAGHGMNIPDIDGDEGEEGRDEALVVADYRPGSEPDGLIIDDELSEILARLSDRRVTMIIDASHSSSIERSFNPSGGHPKGARFIKPPASRSGADIFALDTKNARHVARRDLGVVADDGGEKPDAFTGALREIWTASAPYQPAWEAGPPDAHHGVFTKALVEAMRGGAADTSGNGRVSRAEALSHVRAAAAAFCDRTPECSELNAGFTPMLEVDTSLRGLPIGVWPDTSATKPDTVGTEELLDILSQGGDPADLSIVNLERPDHALKAGDLIAFEIQSPVGGRVILFDIRPGGQLRQLYPSVTFKKDTPLSPNSPMRLPDAFHGVEFRIPPGEGVLVGMVVGDPGIAAKLSQQNTDFELIAQPKEFLGELMQEVTGLWRNDAENRQVRYGVATYRYAVR